MTQQVFDNAMTAHVWAQRSQDSGRSNNGNFFFTGRVLYSYGSHFVVGIIDDNGRAWLNTDGYSNSTAKHKNYAARAVSRAFYIPSLTGIYRAILDIGQKGRAAWVRRELTAYFAAHWQAFNEESEAAAILWRAVSPRGDWPKARARMAAKADRLAKQNASREARQLRVDGARLAAVPLPMIRARMMETAARADDWRLAARLSEIVSELYATHRAATGKRIKRALWERLKLAREIKSKLVDSPLKRAKVWESLAQLRRIRANDYSRAATALDVALAESDCLAVLIEGAPGAGAFRDGWKARRVALLETIAELQREREAARMAEQAAEREAWLGGADVPNRYQLKDERGGALIRAIDAELDGCAVIGGTLETSQGATVPLRHAVRIFAFVRSIRESGASWEAKTAGRDIRVGHFRLDSVAASGDFVAGCHSIHWNETERLARALGIWDCPATVLAPESAEVAE